MKLSEIFTKARKLISVNHNECINGRVVNGKVMRPERYICCAIIELCIVSTITDAEKVVALKLISDRLGGCASVDDWLTEQPGIVGQEAMQTLACNIALFTDRAQDVRLRMVDDMIKEFVAQGK